MGKSFGRTMMAAHRCTLSIIGYQHEISNPKKKGDISSRTSVRFITGCPACSILTATPRHAFIGMSSSELDRSCSAACSPIGPCLRLVHLCQRAVEEVGWLCLHLPIGNLMQLEMRCAASVLHVHFFALFFFKKKIAVARRRDSRYILFTIIQKLKISFKKFRLELKINLTCLRCLKSLG